MGRISCITCINTASSHRHSDKCCVATKMELQRIIALLSLAVLVVAGGAAGLTAEEYWEAKLQNSPMPRAVRDLLHSASENKEETVQGLGGGTNVGVGGGRVDVGVHKPGGGTDVGVGGGRVDVGVHKPGGGTDVGVGGGGVNVGTRTKSGRPVVVRVHPGWNPFEYLYAATETQVKHDPNVALFFLEKDLHAGKKMNLDFSRPSKPATFLPRRIADAIPFSSNKLPEILAKLSVKPDSNEAEFIQSTIKECEAKAMTGEEKFCATSLESMVDLAVSKLGKGVLPISTTADGARRKEYRITEVKKSPRTSRGMVACHRQEYAYAVFLCHKTSTTAVYQVGMTAADGSKADAVAVCHRDTAKWNPKHLAFQVLKVKPGTVPVCHFLPQDHVVWVPK